VSLHQKIFKSVSRDSQIRNEVDVIVPCHNVASYLQRALNSVFVQTFSDFHIYAVNDGSTDGTVRVLEANASRCSFVSQPRAGPAAARNRAIYMSRSPFIAFLDADDEWLPQMLERQIAFIKQDQTLGLVCSACFVSEPGGETRVMSPPQSTPGAGKLFRQLACNCFVFTPTVVVRRLCLEEVGYFNESLAVSEDFNLWLRIAAKWNIASLPEALAITHKRPGSLSGSISPGKRLQDGVAALEHAQSSCLHLSPAERQALRHTLAERFYFYGSFLLHTGAKRSSRPELATAFKLRPTYWRALLKLFLSFLPSPASASLIALSTKLAGRFFRNSTQLEQRDIS
jgi:cellulose synthase/poly-beta-1,6-N-acetylglucosamine synthase-like glycosyltransferase